MVGHLVSLAHRAIYNKIKSQVTIEHEVNLLNWHKEPVKRRRHRHNVLLWPKRLMVTHLPPLRQGQSGVGEGVGELVITTVDVLVELVIGTLVKLVVKTLDELTGALVELKYTELATTLLVLVGTILVGVGITVEVVSGVGTSHSALSASIRTSLVLINLLPSVS